MLERDVVRGTTFGRHVLGVLDGHGEDAAQTRVAHAVAARQFGRASDGHVVGAACQAFGRA